MKSIKIEGYLMQPPSEAGTIHSFVLNTDKPHPIWRHLMKKVRVIVEVIEEIEEQTTHLPDHLGSSDYLDPSKLYPKKKRGRKKKE